jgi:hypothetical protein
LLSGTIGLILSTLSLISVFAAFAAAGVYISTLARTLAALVLVLVVWQRFFSC